MHVSNIGFLISQFSTTQEEYWYFLKTEPYFTATNQETHSHWKIPLNTNHNAWNCNSRNAFTESRPIFQMKSMKCQRWICIGEMTITYWNLIFVNETASLKNKCNKKIMQRKCENLISCGWTLSSPARISRLPQHDVLKKLEQQC